ncbi:MAG: hypothetical protein KDC32_16285 [Saprospiraceae bacterium]|nr:hypothetical protein [Saprospiraceae bacterium]MCB0682446.1 hypothetical protein [Saprospiraceae bacterium]
MKKILPILALVGGVVACRNQAEKVLPGNRYFDLHQYFEQQMERLQQQAHSIRKTTAVNGKQEMRELDSLDFSVELKAFAESNINRAAWQDKYAIDSTFTPGGELAGIRYQAMDSTLWVRQIVLSWEADQISEVQIQKAISTPIATTRQWLRYLPAGKISIESDQKVALSGESRVKVEVRFEREE